MRTRLPFEIGARAFRPIVDRLSHESEIVREESLLRLNSHRVQLGGDAQTLGAKIEAALTRRAVPAAGSQATRRRIKHSHQPTAASENRASRDGTSRPHRQNRHRPLFQPRRRRHAQKIASSSISKLTTRSPPRPFAICSGASRKFAIALLDHFDHTGVTTRVGDTRRLALLRLSLSGRGRASARVRVQIPGCE